MSELSDANLRSSALDRDEESCQYCGRGAAPRRDLHVHHIEAKGDDGPNTLENVVTLCEPHHNAVHGLSDGDDYPIGVLDEYGVPKEIPDIRGLQSYKSVMAIEVLKEGRATPKLLKERTGLNDQQINYALNQLIAAGWVQKITTGLYELRGDPREDNH